MAAQSVGSIVVVGPEGAPTGIVTDRDLRRRVLAAGRSPDEPVGAVMSAPVVTISPEALVFEAVLEMTRRGLHHLPVVEAGRVIGVVSSHDLLLFQVISPLELARAIHAASSIEELEPLMPRLVGVVRQLFEQQATGYQIGRIVSELNDAIIRQVLATVERDLDAADIGRPPVDFCWLALGSEGRREQTIHTDQDNALVYDDPASDGDRRSERYFAVYTERAIATLVRLGYPRCPADAMASNPKWRQPLRVWRAYFADWIRDTTPEHLMYSSIYLDFRPVAGEPQLAVALRNAVREGVAAWRSFPRYLAKIAVSHAPPLGLLGRFRLQRRDGRRGIDLKLGGMLILNNALRAYAVELGLAETNTIERLEAAARVGNCFTVGETGTIRAAYETIFRVRLAHQLARLAAGAAPDNFLEPSILSRADQRSLKDAFHALRMLQGKVESRYFTEPL